jgi:hypothetical protein
MSKLALFLVLGFSAIFLVMGYNAMNVSTRAVENMADYNANTVAYNIAVSGANLGANKIFMDNSWNAGFSNIPYENGTLSVSVSVINPYRNWRKLTSVGTFDGISKTVEVTYAPSNFAKFAYLSINDPTNLYWTDADTIWGPFHSEGDIMAYHHPVFYGKATTNGKVKYLTTAAADAPYFYGGFEPGVSLTFPPSGLPNLKSEAQSNGHYFTGKDSLYLTFAGDSLKFRFKATAKDTTVLASSFAPNGIIFADNAVVRLKGTVSGQYSVGCSGSNSNVFLDDDIVYKKDPRVDPTSNDMLGIVSENNVLITNNAANQHNINVDASIYCEKGGFGAGWLKWLIDNGKINLLGGIQNYKRVQIGQIGAGGFARSYKYDERLLTASPPGYPGTGQLEIVSWFE